MTPPFYQPHKKFINSTALIVYRGYLIICAFVMVLILLARHLLAVPKYALADFKTALPSIMEDWR